MQTVYSSDQEFYKLTVNGDRRCRLSAATTRKNISTKCVVVVVNERGEEHVICAYHSCLSDDDDEMMVRDCVCRIDKDEKNENQWLQRGCVKSDGGVNMLECNISKSKQSHFIVPVLHVIL
jgi:hypothetical protein